MTEISFLGESGIVLFTEKKDVLRFIFSSYLLYLTFKIVFVKFAPFVWSYLVKRLIIQLNCNMFEYTAH